jgi:activator of 2-hydroxyglutaryl-CoA dehydratase
MKTMTDQVLRDRMQIGPTGDRFIGIDVGAETIKAVELFRNDSGLVWSRRQHVEHHKDPGTHVLALLREWNWGGVTAAAVTGRGSRHMDLPAVPVKQAQARGAGFLLGDDPITVISIGSHGFSVLERRASGIDTFRANSRCSQGTGNFLRQLVERFGLSVAEASDLCTEVEDPAPLSGRCPVILKTDMTHLANKGEDRARILAGLFDAVCENVTMLLNPGTTPERVILSGGVSRSARVRKTFSKTLHTTGMRLEETTGDDALYLDALGCAVMAAQRPVPVPPLEKLHVVPQAIKRERLPPLADWMDKVTRMPPLPRISLNGHRRPLTLGFDIGSTGSKAVALDLETS